VTDRTVRTEPDPAHIADSLHGQSTRWLIVHGLTVAFIGLTGLALDLLMRGRPAWRR
jgi:hypothetical protein